MFNLNRVFLSYFVTLYLLSGRVFADPPATPPSGVFSAARGILASQTKVDAVVSSIEWGLKIGSAIPCVFFIVLAGVRFSQERYGAAIACFVGGVVCGIATFIVTTVMA